MAHQPGIKGFHTSQATGIRGLSGLQNPSQLHKGFRLLEPTGIKEKEEEEEANEHLDASDSSFPFKKFHGINFIAKLITVSMATNQSTFHSPPYFFIHSVFDVRSLYISLLQRSKSLSEDMEVKGESLFGLALCDLLV